MGTSTSHKGVRLDASKYLPTEKNPPEPEPVEEVSPEHNPEEVPSEMSPSFRAYRVNLGKFIKHREDGSRKDDYLHKALNGYATRGGGGTLALAAPSISGVAAVVAEFLRKNIATDDNDGRVLQINVLEDLGLEEAVEKVAELLVLQSGLPEYEMCRQGAIEAISVVLQCEQVELTPEDLVRIFLEEYLSSVVFASIAFDSGEAFSGKDSDAVVNAEDEIRDYIKSSVQASLEKSWSTAVVSTLTSGRVQRLVEQIIREVLKSF